MNENKHLEYIVSVASVAANDPIEDKYIADLKSRFFAVFDGHGGYQCSEFVRENLYRNIEKAYDTQYAEMVAKLQRQKQRRLLRERDAQLAKEEAKNTAAAAATTPPTKAKRKRRLSTSHASTTEASADDSTTSSKTRDTSPITTTPARRSQRLKAMTQHTPESNEKRVNGEVNRSSSSVVEAATSSDRDSETSVASTSGVVRTPRVAKRRRSEVDAESSTSKITEKDSTAQESPEKSVAKRSRRTLTSKVSTPPKASTARNDDTPPKTTADTEKETEQQQQPRVRRRRRSIVKPTSPKKEADDEKEDTSDAKLTPTSIARSPTVGSEATKASKAETSTKILTEEEIMEQSQCVDELMTEEVLTTVWENAVNEAFYTTDNQWFDIIRSLPKDAGLWTAGSCAATCLIRESRAIVANVGDSRVVLCKRIEATQNQRPEATQFMPIVESESTESLPSTSTKATAARIVSPIPTRSAGHPSHKEKAQHPKQQYICIPLSIDHNTANPREQLLVADRTSDPEPLRISMMERQRLLRQQYATAPKFTTSSPLQSSMVPVVSSPPPSASTRSGRSLLASLLESEKQAANNAITQKSPFQSLASACDNFKLQHDESIARRLQFHNSTDDTESNKDNNSASSSSSSDSDFVDDKEKKSKTKSKAKRKTAQSSTAAQKTESTPPPKGRVTRSRTAATTNTATASSSKTVSTQQTDNNKQANTEPHRTPTKSTDSAHSIVSSTLSPPPSTSSLTPIAASPLKSEAATDPMLKLKSVNSVLVQTSANEHVLLNTSKSVKRVAGSLLVTRAFGDYYLKRQETSFAPYNQHTPYITVYPEIITHEIDPTDDFIVIASDGLWEHMTNQQVVEFIQTEREKRRRYINLTNGLSTSVSAAQIRQQQREAYSKLAEKLVDELLEVVAKKRGYSVAMMRGMRKQQRRQLFDDTTVIIIFLNEHTNNSNNSSSSHQTELQADEIVSIVDSPDLAEAEVDIGTADSPEPDRSLPRSRRSAR